MYNNHNKTKIWVLILISNKIIMSVRESVKLFFSEQFSVGIVISYVIRQNILCHDNNNEHYLKFRNFEN